MHVKLVHPVHKNPH